MATTTYVSNPVAVFNPLKCFAYPSANAQNQGQLNSEENIRWIMLRLTKRTFTLTPDDFKLVRKSATVFTIMKGNANIDGYHFRCDENTDIDITTEDFMTADLQALIDEATSESSAVKIYVSFNKNVDAAKHLLTYSTDTETQQISKFEGFKLVLTNIEPSGNDFYLGYFTVYKKDGDAYINEVVNNVYKCMFINTSNIYADDDNLGKEERTINNLIKYLINSVLGAGMDSDVICYGPNPENQDGTTNVLLCNKQLYLLAQKDPNDTRLTPAERAEIIEAQTNLNYLRLYYNPNTRQGGLQTIHNLDERKEDSVNTDDKVPNHINIMSFDLSTPSSSTDKSTPSFTLHPIKLTLGKVGGSTTIVSDLSVGGNVTVSGNYKSTGGMVLGDISRTATNGDIIANVITGKKVYGAVWS